MRRRRPRGLQQQPQQPDEHHDDEPPGDFDDLLVIDHDIDDDRRHVDHGRIDGLQPHHGVARPGPGSGRHHHRHRDDHQHGTTSCTADGYPKIALFSGSGAPLTVTIVNGLSVSLSPAASAPPSPVTVAPSSTAQFAYQYSDVPVGAQTSCPGSESATVNLPGATAPSPTFALAIAPCNNGTIRVSPVYAG